MRLIAILMALAISLSAYEFSNGERLYKLIENKRVFCPDGLVDSIVQKAGRIDIETLTRYTQKSITNATSEAEQYEYARVAQKIDKQINDEIETLYNKYITIATKITEDMCDIRDEKADSKPPYKSKLSPEEVYQQLEEYVK